MHKTRWCKMGFNVRLLKEDGNKGDLICAQALCAHDLHKDEFHSPLGKTDREFVCNS